MGKVWVEGWWWGQGREWTRPGRSGIREGSICWIQSRSPDSPSQNNVDLHQRLSRLSSEMPLAKGTNGPLVWETSSSQNSPEGCSGSCSGVTALPLQHRFSPILNCPTHTAPAVPEFVCCILWAPKLPLWSPWVREHLFRHQWVSSALCPLSRGRGIKQAYVRLPSLGGRIGLLAEAISTPTPLPGLIFPSLTQFCPLHASLTLKRLTGSWQWNTTV